MMDVCHRVVSDSVVQRGVLLGPLLPLGATLFGLDPLTAIAWRCNDTLHSNSITLTGDIRASSMWLFHVRSARNETEQNLEAVFQDQGHIFFRATRRIEIGEELMVWFSKDLTEALRLPLEATEVVQSNNGTVQYKCIHCCVSFENPYPAIAHAMCRCSGRFISSLTPLNSSTMPMTTKRSSPKKFDIASLTQSSNRDKNTTPRPASVASDSDEEGSEAVSSAFKETNSETRISAMQSPQPPEPCDNKPKFNFDFPVMHGMPSIDGAHLFSAAFPYSIETSRMFPMLGSVPPAHMTFFPPAPSPYPTPTPRKPTAVKSKPPSTNQTKSSVRRKRVAPSKSPTPITPPAQGAAPYLPPSLAALSFPAQNWCAKCNTSFRMTSDLVYHMRSHHRQELDSTKKKRDEKLRCIICNETFRERHHLTRHMTSHQ